MVYLGPLKCDFQKSSGVPPHLWHGRGNSGGSRPPAFPRSCKYLNNVHDYEHSTKCVNRFGSFLKNLIKLPRFQNFFYGRMLEDRNPLDRNSKVDQKTVYIVYICSLRHLFKISKYVLL